jgi:opacity protein-like surface antigen
MTTPKTKTATAVLLTGLLLAACSGTQEMSMAQEAAVHFHEMMSAGQFEQIYAQSDDSFKKATTAEDSTRFLSTVNRKLGVVKTSGNDGWSMGFTPSGTSVTLRYTTQFEHGTGAETFLYRLANGRALLAGYHVNSNAFITN